MCGRFASKLPADAVRSMFGTVGEVPNLPPSWNVAPTNNAMVVRRHPETGERRLYLLRWGLIPSWIKDLKPARAQPINTRLETAATSSMFKAALTQRGYLVPADAFYEWETRPDGKQLYAIARRDGAPLAFAGLWEWWKAPDETLRSFTILTTEANATVRVLHERMPVILEPDAWPVWLGEDSDAAADLMRPAGNDVLHLWPVSRPVNSVRNNGAELLDRVAIRTRDYRATGGLVSLNPAVLTLAFSPALQCLRN